ncbi:MAG: hypothetical protein ACPGLV_11655 [Bacteroidia bacterium]
MAEEHYNYKVKIPPHWNYAELENAIANGAQFKIYEFVISFGLAIHRVSKAHIVPSEQKAYVAGLPYLFLSLILGWWSLPKGPYYVYLTIKTILNGGIDITEDVLVNLNKTVFESSINGGVFEVELKKATQFFAKMNSGDFKLCKKILRKNIHNFPEIDGIAIGMFVNTEAPFRCIGIQTKNNVEPNSDAILELIYKKFYKRIHFEIIHLNNYDLKNEFEKQAIYLSRESLIFDK